MANKTINDVDDQSDQSSEIENNDNHINTEFPAALKPENICDFINNAPNEKYLAAKVVLIFGIAGACKTTELFGIKINDVKKVDDIYCIKIPSVNKKNKSRSFTINKEFSNIINSYINLRPHPDRNCKLSKNFFLQYSDGKCTNLQMTRSTVANVPKLVADYLKLPNAELFTSYCFRQTSAYIQDKEKEESPALTLEQESPETPSDQKDMIDSHQKEEKIFVDVSETENNSDNDVSYKNNRKQKIKEIDKYEEFVNWRKSTGIVAVNEIVLLAYFAILSNKLEPNTIMATYSLIKTQLWKQEKINIRHYSELNTFLKRNCKNNIVKGSDFYTPTTVIKAEKVPKIENNLIPEPLDETCEASVTEMSDSEDENSDTLAIENDFNENIDSDNLNIKSKLLYIQRYDKFNKWREANNCNTVDEKILIDYFEALALKFQPNSLLAIFSMLKLMLKQKENVDIGRYKELLGLIKKKSENYQPRKSNVLSAKNISDFLYKAPDEKFLAIKVVLIFNICGCLRYTELKRLRFIDVQLSGKIYRVRVPISNNKYTRTFFINEEFYGIVKKYINLRPNDEMTSDFFFLNYQNGKCTKQVIGRNKMSHMPKQIAEYLKLPDAKNYICHSLRRTSPSLIPSVLENLSILKMPKNNDIDSDPLSTEEIKNTPNENSEADALTNESVLPECEADIFEDTSACLSLDMQVSDSKDDSDDDEDDDDDDDDEDNNDNNNDDCDEPKVISIQKEWSTKEGDWLKEKSLQLYKNRYKKFMEWRTSNNIEKIDEQILLNYFTLISKNFKPSTLFSIYSAIKIFLKDREQVDLSNFKDLLKFLKDLTKNYEPKRAAKLSSQNIVDFLQNAPDETYLVSKVVLIFGISGACKTSEMKLIRHQDVKEHGQIYCVNIPISQSKLNRSFIIDEEFYPFIKKYINMRPKKNPFKEFFMNFKGGKCLQQPLGRNKIASTPKVIAEWLKLPDPNSYTSHSFRETSCSIRNMLKVNMNSKRKRKSSKSSKSSSKKYKRTTAKNPLDPLEDPLQFESCYIKEEIKGTESEESDS